MLGLAQDLFLSSTTRAILAPGVMTAPEASVHAGSVRVAFSVAPDDGGAAIDAYGWAIARHDDPEFLAPAAEGLQADRVDEVTVALSVGVYVARTRARNISGWGSWSPTSDPAIVTTVPSAMQPPTLSGGERVATLELATPPVDGGAAITGYDWQVARLDSGFLDLLSQGAIPAADRGVAVALSSLAPGSYEARSRAVNAAGAGPWSAASAAAHVKASLDISAAAAQAKGWLSLRAVDETATAPCLIPPVGTAPFAWSLEFAPDGLTVDTATGVLRATTLAAGVHTAGLLCRDATGAEGRAALDVTVADARAAFVTSFGGWTGADLLDLIPLHGDLSFQIADGAPPLPAGMTLWPKLGLVDGVPATVGCGRTLIAGTDGAQTRRIALDWTVTHRSQAAVSGGGTHLVIGAAGSNTNELPSGVSAPEALATMTFAAHVALTASAASTGLFSVGGRSSFDVTSTGNLSFRVADTQGGATFTNHVYTTSGAKLRDGAWHVIVVQFQAATSTTAGWMRAWIDGVDMGLQSIATSKAGVMTLRRGRWAVGVDQSFNAMTALPAGSQLGFVALAAGHVDPALYGTGAASCAPELASSHILLAKGVLAEWNSGAALRVATNASATFVRTVFGPAFSSPNPAPAAADPTPLFAPDAQGWGRAARGGLGASPAASTFLRVTSTADDAAAPPPGSLRAAVQTAGTDPLYIMLDVDGPIRLKDALRVTRPNVTIDGRFSAYAPVLVNATGVKIEDSNIVLRNCNLLPGSARDGQIYQSRDGVSIGRFNLTPAQDIENVAVYRNSLWASTDEGASNWSSPGTVGRESFNRKITWQDNIIGESLAFPREQFTWEGANVGTPAGAYRQGHNKLFLVGNQASMISIIRNLLIGGYERNPLVKDGSRQIEVVNNVIANLGNSTTVFKPGCSGLVRGNIYMPGPLTPANRSMVFVGDWNGVGGNGAAPQVWVAENVLHTWSGGVRTITPQADDPGPIAMRVRYDTTAGVYIPLADLSDPGVVVQSVYAAMPVAEVVPHVRARAGARDQRNGALHPVIRRLMQQSIGVTADNPAPFAEADGCFLRAGFGLADELLHLGVWVTPGPQSLQVLVRPGSLPAASEPWVSIVAEAASCGLPVIRSRGGGELEPGWNALGKGATELGRIFPGASTDPTTPLGAIVPGNLACDERTPQASDARPDWTTPVTANVPLDLSAPATITGLNPDLAYAVRVRWVDAAGREVVVEPGTLWQTAA